MYSIHARNVNSALLAGIRLIREVGEPRHSRNGDVLQAPVPVSTCYEHPDERVLFWPWRDANPFFHLMEALWMLAGRDDLATVAHYVKRMETFSDDGQTLHGAYGKRWRDWFKTRRGPDQLRAIMTALREDPTDRRQVLQMWDPAQDLERQGRDVPCNLTATFQVNSAGMLDMSVFNRSNDIIWGAYGANAVHFSLLQEYVAAGAGVPLGRYWQISTNWHAYVPILNMMPGERDLPGFTVTESPHEATFTTSRDAACPYELGAVEPTPLFPGRSDTHLDEISIFDEEVRQLLSAGPEDVGIMRTPFLEEVARPMMRAHDAWKLMRGQAGYDAAREFMHRCSCSDWYLAGNQWLDRRFAAWQRARDDGPHAAPGVEEVR